MNRCFQLARKAFRDTNKNPMVGAIMVNDGRIIGEGYHEKYGEAHAEVNCYKSINKADREKINESTLYVSLEPCSFHGKTPACTSLICATPPAKVILSTIDPNPKVAGTGIKILEDRGIKVKSGICEQDGIDLIRKFNINIFQKRPYIALKWAKSKHNYAGIPGKPVWFTGQESRFFAHKLRSKFEAILIANNTVNIDNPQLDNRLASGPSPIKIVIDRNEQIDKASKLFHQGEKVIIFTTKKDYHRPSKLVHVEHISSENFKWMKIMKKLYGLNITSVLIEGGPSIQKSFINEGLWDEAHVLSSNHPLQEGIKAPLASGKLKSSVYLGEDHYQMIFQEN